MILFSLVIMIGEEENLLQYYPVNYLPTTNSGLRHSVSMYTLAEKNQQTVICPYVLTPHRFAKAWQMSFEIIQFRSRENLADQLKITIEQLNFQVDYAFLYGSPFQVNDYMFEESSQFAIQSGLAARYWFMQLNYKLFRSDFNCDQRNYEFFEICEIPLQNQISYYITPFNPLINLYFNTIAVSPMLGTGEELFPNSSITVQGMLQMRHDIEQSGELVFAVRNVFEHTNRFQEMFQQLSDMSIMQIFSFLEVFSMILKSSEATFQIIKTPQYEYLSKVNQQQELSKNLKIEEIYIEDSTVLIDVVDYGAMQNVNVFKQVLEIVDENATPGYHQLSLNIANYEQVKEFENKLIFAELDSNTQEMGKIECNHTGKICRSQFVKFQSPNFVLAGEAQLKIFTARRDLSGRKPFPLPVRFTIGGFQSDVRLDVIQLSNARLTVLFPMDYSDQLHIVCANKQGLQYFTQQLSPETYTIVVNLNEIPASGRCYAQICERGLDASILHYNSRYCARTPYFLLQNRRINFYYLAVGLGALAIVFAVLAQFLMSLVLKHILRRDEAGT